MFKMIFLLLGLAVGFGGGVYWAHHNPDEAAKLAAAEEKKLQVGHEVRRGHQRFVRDGRAQRLSERFQAGAFSSPGSGGDIGELHGGPFGQGGMMAGEFAQVGNSSGAMPMVVRQPGREGFTFQAGLP